VFFLLHAPPVFAPSFLFALCNPPELSCYDYNSSQNDLIFKTRSRLFKLEHNFRLLVLAIAVAGSVLALTGLAVING